MHRVAPQAQQVDHDFVYAALDLIVPPETFEDDGEHDVVECPGWCTRGDEHCDENDRDHWSRERWPEGVGTMIHVLSDGGSPMVRLQLGDHIEISLHLDEAEAVRDTLTAVLADFADGAGRTKRVVLPTDAESTAQLDYRRAAGPFEPPALAWTDQLWAEWEKRYEGSTGRTRMELFYAREAHFAYVDAYVYGPSWPQRYAAADGDAIEAQAQRDRGAAAAMKAREQTTARVLAEDLAYALEVEERRAHVRTLRAGKGAGA